jgi:hypothetical protein
MEIGDQVRVGDGSSAHGSLGTVVFTRLVDQYGPYVLVRLDESGVPVPVDAEAVELVSAPEAAEHFVRERLYSVRGR